MDFLRNLAKLFLSHQCMHQGIPVSVLNGQGGPENNEETNELGKITI